MAFNKSLDEVSIINAMLADVSKTFGVAFGHADLLRTQEKVRNRTDSEGLSFLTKTLPALGKALDRALCVGHLGDLSPLRLGTVEGSQLPRFLGELFALVFDATGRLLPEPNVNSVGALRDILYCFYKYELSYAAEDEQAVISKFVRTEEELLTSDEWLDNLADSLQYYEEQLAKLPTYSVPDRLEVFEQVEMLDPKGYLPVVRAARSKLYRLFASFDPLNIRPRHGPGAVATREKLWSKFVWTNVSSGITDYYPFDSYFQASVGACCDRYKQYANVSSASRPAKVILVPKDSRGPRLISCEPVDYQWIQQGLGRAIVEHVEAHPLTKWCVHFTDQRPNQLGALLGSLKGNYATLDLAEASDRVSLKLVRLLFPKNIIGYLEACRTSATVLPDGRIQQLRKFAPMGSALCFPIMALTIWSLLSSLLEPVQLMGSELVCEDNDPGLLVYGDDVIVHTARAGDAIRTLERFGLKVNADKSCTSGFFRESCGCDAYKGEEVTPVRFRTVWSSTQSADVFSSWVAYANALYEKRYYEAYSVIAAALFRTYGTIPSKDMGLTCPSLADVPREWLPRKVRTNHDLQKRQWKVLDVVTPTIKHNLHGWDMLLRYFTECEDISPERLIERRMNPVLDYQNQWVQPSVGRSVSSYRPRDASMLVPRWR